MTGDEFFRALVIFFLVVFAAMGVTAGIIGLGGYISFLMVKGFLEDPTTLIAACAVFGPPVLVLFTLRDRGIFRGCSDSVLRRNRQTGDLRRRYLRRSATAVWIALLLVAIAETDRRLGLVVVLAPIGGFVALNAVLLFRIRDAGDASFLNKRAS